MTVCVRTVAKVEDELRCELHSEVLGESEHPEDAGPHVSASCCQPCGCEDSQVGMVVSLLVTLYGACHPVPK